MKKLLITFLFTMTSVAAVNTFADTQGWEEMKGLCVPGAINAQDRAHKPTVSCKTSRSGGYYKEKMVETFTVDRDITREYNEEFMSTFNTDKSKDVRRYMVPQNVPATNNSKPPKKVKTRECENFEYTEFIEFTYNRADTCKLIQDKQTPKAFCDYVLDNVFSEQEKQEYTSRTETDRNSDEYKDCEDDKGSKK